jgi:hypothetical protein
MNKFFLAITFLLCANYSLGQFQQQILQESPDWLAKYWLYRWRFINDFIKVGDQQGESIPFAERNSYNQQDLKTGDGTQKLGMYLCVLATEYALLYENERWTDLEKTKTELYYALEAIERLDCTTEEYPPYSFPWINSYNCNGYLMRDDIHAGFLDEPAKYWDLADTRTNRNLINQDYTKFCYPHGMGDVTDLHNYPLNNSQGSSELNGSDFISHQLDPTQRINEPSKDQYLCLWQGLGLVSKLVHAYNYTITKVDGSLVQYNFYAKARELYVRLLENMKYETFLGNPTFALDWNLTTPYSEITEFNGGISAGIGLPFAFPLAQAANKVIYNENNMVNHLPYLGIPTGYHDIITIPSYILWYPTLIDFSQQTDGGTVNQSMYCQIAAMSDAWRAGPFPLSVINRTPHAIYEHAIDYDWEAYYVSLWSVWNNKPIPNSNQLRNMVINATRNDLNNAPCIGPYNVTPMATGIKDYPFEWASIFKYFRTLSETRYGNIDSTGLPDGYYNGLDYLLMHNLFYLSYNGALPYFHDLVDRIIDFPVPGIYPGNPFNVNLPQPIVVNAFHSITANSTVQTNYDTEFRAGYEITFKPGFHVESGANFHAYIEPFTCDAHEFQYRNQNTDSTIATAYGFNEKFNFTNHGIIDYSKDETEEEIAQNTEPEIDLKSLLMVYPNPCTDKFTYIVSDQTELNKMQQIELYNMIGELVQTENINYNGQNILDITHLPSGIYVVKVISGERVYSAKIMVEE